MEKGALVILARINHQLACGIGDLRKRLKREETVGIADYLDEQTVAFLDVADRNEALAAMIDTLSAAGKLQDKETFFQAILERERIVSTGIGMGVAVPHAKLEGYRNFFIAIGIQARQGIEWNALDSAPVHLIFMIGGPSNQQAQYLQILSSLTSAIRNEERHKKLLRVKTPKQVIELFAGC